ncbi:MAG: TfoX/Sxy family protein [Paracoccaceae bacterium]
MAVTAEDIDFVCDLFAGVGPITYRKMMGGLSIYADGQIFAILSADGQIYLKANGVFAEELAAMGERRFAMERDGVTRSMGYYTMPGEALDDPELAVEWGRRALAALG